MNYCNGKVKWHCLGSIILIKWNQLREIDFIFFKGGEIYPFIPICKNCHWHQIGCAPICAMFSFQLVTFQHLFLGIASGCARNCLPTRKVFHIASLVGNGFTSKHQLNIIRVVIWDSMSVYNPCLLHGRNDFFAPELTSCSQLEPNSSVWRCPKFWFNSSRTVCEPHLVLTPSNKHSRTHCWSMDWPKRLWHLLGSDH